MPKIPDPTTVTEVEAVFGTTKLLPPYEQVSSRGRDRFTQIANDLFFKGGKLSDHGLRVRDGLDPAAVRRALQAHLGSWEPSHEHKETGVGWLIEQWTEPEGDR